jgi:anti-anti-sigma factor
MARTIDSPGSGAPGSGTAVSAPTPLGRHDNPDVLTVQVRRSDPSSDAVVIGLIGELDCYTGPVLGCAVSDVVSAGGQKVVLDVSGLTFCDAAGLGIFVAAQQQCRRGGGWVRLAGATESLVRLMTLGGLGEALPCYRDVAEAVAEAA